MTVVLGAQHACGITLPAAETIPKEAFLSLPVAGIAYM